MDVWVFWVEDMELDEALAFQMRDHLDGVPGVGGGTVHECQHHCYFKNIYNPVSLYPSQKNNGKQHHCIWRNEVF